MWVRQEELMAMDVQDDSHLDKLHALRVHPKLKHKCACQPCCITALQLPTNKFCSHNSIVVVPLTETSRKLPVVYVSPHHKALVLCVLKIVAA